MENMILEQARKPVNSYNSQSEEEANKKA